MITIDGSIQFDFPSFGVVNNDQKCKWYDFEPFGVKVPDGINDCITEPCQTFGKFNLKPCSRSKAYDWYVTIGNVQTALYLERTNRENWKSYVWKGDSTSSLHITGTSNWIERPRSEKKNHYCFYYNSDDEEITWGEFTNVACVTPKQIKNLDFTDNFGPKPSECQTCSPDSDLFCLGFSPSNIYYLTRSGGNLKSCHADGVATGITAPCLANRKSWSAPVCAFIEGSGTIDSFGSCITLHWLTLRMVMQQYSTIFYFKFPSTLSTKMHLKVFSDSSCKNYKTEYRGSIANDFNVNPSVQISFDDNSGLRCGVCDNGYGTEGADKFYEKAGVHECRLCRKPAEYEFDGVKGLCSRQYKECRMCSEHSEYKNGGCVHCPANKPKRSNDPFDQHCTTCNKQTEWFNSLIRECKTINTRQLVLEADMPSGIEYYHSNQNDLTDNGYSPVRTDFYLDISGEMRIQLPCSTYCSSIPFTFAHNCGTQGTTVYAQNKVTKAIDPWSETRTIAGIDPNNYKIEQAGKCEPCQECSIGNYNDGCGVNNEDGTCEICLQKDSCSENQYLDHTDDEGCNQTRARSNYECKECKAWEVDPDDTVWLWVGCGRKPTITTWTFTGTISKQLGTCAYKSQDLSGDISQCEYRGKTITPRYEMQKFWGRYSMRIPYCPKSYFVELAKLRSEKEETEQYDPDYCTLCQSERVDQRIDESQYRECDGSSSIDTQKLGIVNSCEANRYEDEISGSCKMCETCSGGRL